MPLRGTKSSLKVNRWNGGSGQKQTLKERLLKQRTIMHVGEKNEPRHLPIAAGAESD